jgi:hypothetical protein
MSSDRKNLRSRFLALAAAAPLSQLSALPVLADAPNSEAQASLGAAIAEAWWTGPMIANSAATLPTGHVLIEPYLFDRLGKGSNAYGSLVYMLYGLTDKLTLGVSPTFGYDTISKGRASSGPSVGDVTLRAQYSLLRAPAGTTRPSLAIALGYTLPTGKFDHLGDRPGDGIGQGANVTTVSLYEQNVLRMPNARPLRARINLSYSMTNPASVAGISVYGTDSGFRGKVHQTDSLSIGTSLEY